MSQMAPEPTPATSPTPAPAEPTAAAATPPVAEPTQPTPPAADPWADPAVARAEIEKLRRENASARTNAKQTAADEARKELTQQIGKALGLLEDEVDPEKLTAELTASQASAKQAQIELAVFRAAGDLADPQQLLDSRAFLEKVAAIDPTDSAALTAAITAAVEANPRLGKASAPPVPGMQPNPAQGASASAPLALGDQIAAAQEKGDVRALLRLKASQVLAAGPSGTPT